MKNLLRNILLVEDDENDLLFFRHALKRLHFRGFVAVCRNGDEAVEYITGCGAYGDREKYPFPQLVITNWKMPVAGGKELLKWMRDHPHYMVMPVIILSSSAEDVDVKDAYCAGATAYLMKPATQAQLGEMLNDFIRFWTHVIKPKLEVHAPCEHHA